MWKLETAFSNRTMIFRSRTYSTRRQTRSRQVTGSQSRPSKPLCPPQTDCVGNFLSINIQRKEVWLRIQKRRRSSSNQQLTVCECVFYHAGAQILLLCKVLKESIIFCHLERTTTLNPCILQLVQTRMSVALLPRVTPLFHETHPFCAPANQVDEVKHRPIDEYSKASYRHTTIEGSSR